MSDHLRIGAISDDWTDPTVVSMARDIEAAFESVMGPFPAGDNPDPRRKLAIAIATGVINHLKNNEDAFTIQVPAIVGPTVPASATIKVLP